MHNSQFAAQIYILGCRHGKRLPSLEFTELLVFGKSYWLLRSISVTALRLNGILNPRIGSECLHRLLKERKKKKTQELVKCHWPGCHLASSDGKLNSYKLKFIRVAHQRQSALIRDNRVFGSVESLSQSLRV